MSNLKPAPIQYDILHEGGWGWVVALIEPKGYDEDIEILPDDPNGAYGWLTPEEARAAAVIALRDLADRIERGEE